MVVLRGNTTGRCFEVVEGVRLAHFVSPDCRNAYIYPPLIIRIHVAYFETGPKGQLYTIALGSIETLTASHSEGKTLIVVSFSRSHLVDNFERFAAVIWASHSCDDTSDESRWTGLVCVCV